MKASVQRWGNSLALRLPKSVVKHLGLDSGSKIEMSIQDDRLVIIPVSTWESELEEMLNRIGPENQHPEVETGHPVGEEVW